MIRVVAGHKLGCLLLDMPARPGQRVPGEVASEMRQTGLTSTQRRIWFAEQLGGPGATYVLPFAIRLVGNLDTESLHRSLNECVRSHDILRTTFEPTEDGLARPVVGSMPAGAGITMRTVSAQGASSDARAAHAFELASAHVGSPMDLLRGPLISPLLIRVDPDDHLLALPLHHLVADGRSFSILYRQLLDGYNRLRSGLPCEAKDVRQYSELADDEEGARAALEFFTPLVESAPDLFTIAKDQPRRTHFPARGHDAHRALRQSIVQAVRKLAVACRVTPFTVYCAAAQLVVAERAGTTTGVLGFMCANRNSATSRHVIGPVANMLPLVVDLSFEDSCREHLARTQGRLIDAVNHSDLQFDQLVREMSPARKPGVHPVFQVMLTDDPIVPAPTTTVDGCAVTPARLDNGTSWLDLELELRPTPSGDLDTHVRARSDIVDPPEIDSFLHDFESVLRAMTESPESTLSALRTSISRNKPDVRYHTAPKSHDILDLVPGRRLDAAAIGYIPLSVAAQFNGRKDTLTDALNSASPLLRRIILTPSGAVGHYLIPMTASDLFASPAMTGAAVSQCIRDAQRLGAKRAALTGLLPSSLDYGRSLLAGIDRDMITTGDDVRAATVVLNVVRALHHSDTTLEDHDMVCIGLGSVGRAIVCLALDVLGRPARLLLVEGPGNLVRAVGAAREIRERHPGLVVDCEQSDPATLPDRVYDGSLIVGSVSTPDVMDISRVRRGTIVVDYSAPHMFDLEAAAKRHVNGEIYVTEGGMLEWPGELSEIRWSASESVISSCIDRLQSFRYGSSVMGCLVAGLVSTANNAPSAIVGHAGTDELRAAYTSLLSQGFTGVSPRLHERRL